VTELAISKFGVDGCGIGVEETSGICDRFIGWNPFNKRDDGMGEAFNRSFDVSCCHDGFVCVAGALLALA
jgi:hypothetical protein